MVLDPSQWPNDLHWVLQEFIANKERWIPKPSRSSDYWSPRFFLAVEGRIAQVSHGISGWQSEIMPKLRALVG